MEYHDDLIIVFGFMSGGGSNRYLPPLIWAGLIIVGSSIPNLSGLEMKITMADKIAHFAEYFVLGFLVARAFMRFGIGSTRKIAGFILMAAVFGILDELHQAFIPGRTVDILDMAADVLGSFSAIMTYVWLAGRRRARL